ncbi:hypothetical protein [Campylobacter sp. 19-13652]|uniref:hypothetical protein n=1 Tax=Campylobacter sp. 19-13652 TaxID=2840180 RepID=UPI001C85E6C4|nr:hypothetical protein [Campylobacter sp. 19-13652]
MNIAIPKVLRESGGSGYETCISSVASPLKSAFGGCVVGMVPFLISVIVFTLWFFEILVSKHALMVEKTCKFLTQSCKFEF